MKRLILISEVFFGCMVLRSTVQGAIGFSGQAGGVEVFSVAGSTLNTLSNRALQAGAIVVSGGSAPVISSTYTSIGFAVAGASVSQVSINASGIVFPDSSVQTTASGSGLFTDQGSYVIQTTTGDQVSFGTTTAPSVGYQVKIYGGLEIPSGQILFPDGTSIGSLSDTITWVEDDSSTVTYSGEVVIGDGSSVGGKLNIRATRGTEMFSLQSSSGASEYIRSKTYQNAVNTSGSGGASSTTIHTITMTSSSVSMIDAYVIAFDTQNANSASYRFTSSFKRVGTAAPVHMGTTFYSVHEDSSGWNVYMDSGTTNQEIRLNVLGAAGRGVNWQTKFDHIWMSTFAGVNEIAHGSIGLTNTSGANTASHGETQIHWSTYTPLVEGQVSYVHIYSSINTAITAAIYDMAGNRLAEGNVAVGSGTAWKDVPIAPSIVLSADTQYRLCFVTSDTSWTRYRNNTGSRANNQAEAYAVTLPATISFNDATGVTGSGLLIYADDNPTYP